MKYFAKAVKIDYPRYIEPVIGAIFLATGYIWVPALLERTGATGAATQGDFVWSGSLAAIALVCWLFGRAMLIPWEVARVRTNAINPSAAGEHDVQIGIDAVESIACWVATVMLFLSVTAVGVFYQKVVDGFSAWNDIESWVGLIVMLVFFSAAYDINRRYRRSVIYKLMAEAQFRMIQDILPGSNLRRNDKLLQIEATAVHPSR